MKSTAIAVTALLSLALAACDAGSAPDSGARGDPAAPGSTAGAGQPADASAPAPDGDPAGVPAGAPGLEVQESEARFEGFGPLRFGMSADEARAAWEGGLAGGPEGEGSECYHLWPASQAAISDFALMFGDGRFVRYSVEGSEALAAPGAGRVGMPEAEIERLYGAGMERTGHKYVDGGEYLRIRDPAGGNAVLVFETDAQDTVTGWRVGLPPQVDYVEGCS